MALLNNYFNVGSAETRGYFPEGINSIVTSFSTNTTVSVAGATLNVYLNNIYLLPFYIRKPTNSLRICFPIVALTNTTSTGSITFGIYSPKDEKTLIDSQKIYEVSLFNNTTVPTIATHIISAPSSLFLKPGWIYLAILIQGNPITCRAYANSNFRSIRGNIPYTSSNQIRDISTALDTSLNYTSFSSTYSIQIAKSGDNTFPSTNYDNSYTSLPSSVHNYVEKINYSTPLAYLIY